jgi:hypothetical protein
VRAITMTRRHLGVRVIGALDPDRSGRYQSASPTTI